MRFRCYRDRQNFSFFSILAFAMQCKYCLCNKHLTNDYGSYIMSPMRPNILIQTISSILDIDSKTVCSFDMQYQGDIII